jgi:histidyl-tRNA synthetase
MMAADTMEALGFERGQYVIKVNNRKVLDGVMEAIGLAARRMPDEADCARAIDKLDRLGVEGVRQLLGEGARTKAGDFTKGGMVAKLRCSDGTAFINVTGWRELGTSVTGRKCGHHQFESA